jgi:hypothetical protein
VPAEAFPLEFLLKTDLQLPLPVLLHAGLLVLLDLLGVLQELLVDVVGAVDSVLVQILPGLLDLVAYLLAELVALLLEFGTVVDLLQRLAQELPLLLQLLVDFVVVVDAFLLVHRLVPVVLVLHLQHFEPLPHHLHVVVHLLQLRGCLPRVRHRLRLRGRLRRGLSHLGRQ